MDACRDTTLIILMVAAAASLALGIKTEVSSSTLSRCLKSLLGQEEFGSSKPEKKHVVFNCIFMDATLLLVV